MGGLGPGIGGFEYLIIALVALLVVGPERLPLMLRKLGQWTAKARNMANEFRASFDEMARQSELDELRKEVEALRRGQGLIPLGDEADKTFREIRDDLNRPLSQPTPATSTAEWPDSPPASEPVEAEAAPAPAPKARKTRASKVASETAAPSDDATAPGPNPTSTPKRRSTRAKSSEQ